MSKADLIRKLRINKLIKPFYSGIGHVLVFHRVCYDNNTVFHNNNYVSPEYLDRILGYFVSQKIDIVTLDECYARIRSREPTKRFVSFSFDDGYVDNITYALPVFEKYNLPFSLFLTTGFPDGKIFPWGYSLEKMILSERNISLKMHGETYNYSTEMPEEKRMVFYKIRNYLRESNGENLVFKLKEVFNERFNELALLRHKLMMTWEQVTELSRHSLVTIGSHTVSHSVLSKMSDNEVISEINQSVKEIERRIGNKVSYLAYPYGGEKEAGPREFAIAQQCGIKMAFTAINGNIYRHNAGNMTAIPRIGLNENWSLSNLELFIDGFTPFINRFR